MPETDMTISTRATENVGKYHIPTPSGDTTKTLSKDTTVSAIVTFTPTEPTLPEKAMTTVRHGTGSVDG